MSKILLLVILCLTMNVKRLFRAHSRLRDAIVGRPSILTFSNATSMCLRSVRSIALPLSSVTVLGNSTSVDRQWFLKVLQHCVRADSETHFYSVLGGSVCKGTQSLRPLSD